MYKSREKSILPDILLFLVVISSAWGIVWSFSEWGISQQRYFTNQANLIVLVTVFLVFINKHDQKWFKYLAAIALIDITMTGIIYHMMLATPPVEFQSHLTHTITPILYILFYFIVLEETIKPKQFWIALIHPAMYFLFFLITGPIIGFYPYGFMDASQQGLSTVLQFAVLFMLPAIAMTSWILLFLKKTMRNI